jgi:hypothetical protein
MTTTNIRIGGAYTRLTWSANGSSKSAVNLAWVDVIQESAPQPVAQAQPIQPVDSEYPLEIAFPGALEAGSLTVTIREQWNTEVWNAFYSMYNDIPANYATNSDGSNKIISDLLGVFKAQLAAGTVALSKIIVDPTTRVPIRQINYMNPTIVNVAIDETVNIGTMTFPKSIQFMYTQRIEQYAVAPPGGVGGSTAATLSDPGSLIPQTANQPSSIF